MPRAFALLLVASLGACATPDPAPPSGGRSADVTAAPSLDANLVVATAEEAVRLGDHRGHVLVLQLAAASDEAAWLAFADAAPDLQAEGATLLGIVTEGRLDGSPALPFPARHARGLDWAEPLGFTGEALTVVVGPQGRLRGRGTRATADDIVVLAAPVLLELDAGGVDLDVEVLTASTVEALVRHGAALIDVRPEGEPLAHALAVPLAHLTPDVLPPDPATPLVFVGPEAAAAAAIAADWGYAETHALADPTGLAMAAPIDALPVYDARDDLPRVRG